MENKKIDWEKIYKEVSGNIDDLICHLDKNGNIIFINHKFKKTLDILSTDIIGNHYSNYCFGVELKRIEKELKKVFSGKSISFVFNLNTFSGKTVKTRALARPIGDPSSDDFIILLILKDVLRKQRIEKINIRRAKLLDFLFHFESEFLYIFEISDTYKKIVDLLEQKLSIAYCGLYIKSQDSDDYTLLYHKSKQDIPDQLLTLKNQKETFFRKVSYISEKLAEESPLNRLFDMGIDCLFTVPFNCDNEWRGIILLGGDSGSDFDLRDVAFFKTLGSRFSGILKNISLFKKVEKAKQEWESTFDAIRDPVVILDMNGLIIRANISALECLPGREHLGKVKYSDVFDYHAIDGFNPALKTLETGGKKTGLLYDPDNGKYFYVNSYPIFNKKGKIEKAVVSHKDITLFVDTFSQNELLALALKSTKDSIVIFDPDYKILFANDALQDVFGYSTKEVVGEDFRKIFLAKFPPDKIDDIIDNITNKGWECEIIQENNEGETFLALVSLSPVFDGDDKLVMILASIRDITQEKETHQKLIHSEKLRAMGEMISCIAHELKNPLTGIIGFAEIVKKKYENYQAVVGYDMYQPPDCLEEIDLMHRQAERAYHIVKDLLTFARNQKLEVETVNMNKLVEETIELLRNEMNKSNVKIEFSFNHELPDTSGNPYQLQQVLINILTNAQQALQSVDRKKIIKIQTSEYSGYILIKICDNGSGIPTKYMRNVFNPFFTTKKSGMGTGLGLSLSYGIIKNHDGDILVKNNKEYGATFLIKLPIQSLKEYNQFKRDISTLPEKEQKYEKLSVLIVDDEESICKLILQILKLMEFKKIDKANSGHKAIEMMENKDYDLLITDVNLPDINGFDLYEEVSSIGTSIPTYTIFTSGEVMEDFEVEAPPEHRIDYLKKPFSVRDFMEKIKSLLA